MTVADDEAFAFRLQAAPAPLLCAGLIGYRALVAGEAERWASMASAPPATALVAQVARHRGQRVMRSTRPGDGAAQALARKLGAVWAGGSDEAHRPARRRRVFAPAGGARSSSARPGGARRNGRLRRHPHERHPVVPLLAPLRRSGRRGREPDPPGRRRAPGARRRRVKTEVPLPARRPRSTTSARAISRRRGPRPAVMSRCPAHGVLRARRRQVEVGLDLLRRLLRPRPARRRARCLPTPSCSALAGAARAH